LRGEIELADLDGRDGFQISGERENDLSGGSVSSAGDVNGDGFDDLVIGAIGADVGSYGSGAAYLVFGKAGGFNPNLRLSNLDGANGFRISGEEQGIGISVSGAGDVNGDGFDDIVIGADDADPRGRRSGATYVVFGAAAGFDASLDLSDLDGGNGFQISGEDAEDGSGRSVSAAGDVNGDGFADIIIGASGADPSGEGSDASYVVFGTARGFEAELRLSELDGRNGFQISGEEGDFSGVSVSGAGDVDGDGFDDLLVGATGADPNGTSSGTAYVIYGEATGPVSRTGTAGDDRLAGGSFDRLSGAGGDDRLQGEAGDDLLRGGRGDHRLQGGNGDDRLRGDLGADVLNGGKGADLFVFRSVAESSKDASDAIVDFPGTDLIDLRKVDANPDRDGDQDFTFRDDRGFTGEGGEVTLRRSNGDTIVVADRDGDGRADLRIVLDGGVRLDADDFLL
jgi:Ca2+-binding RTX toxin-like protein